MISSPLTLRFTGASVLRDGTMQARSVAIENGVISKGPLPEVDLSGYLVLPGIIDLHGDGFERHIAPRPQAHFSLGTALRATDVEAAANGVTTAYMAHGWSWEGGKRGPDHAEAFMKALDAFRATMVTDLRIQVRCETHMVDSVDRLLSAVRRHRIDYVVFNDHIDQTLLAIETDPVWLARMARDAGIDPATYLARVKRAAQEETQVPRFLCKLADAFDTLGVLYGSHDDGDGETRERYSMIGAKICEFPTRRAAAALARAVGDPILMGAPNVVRGGSQSGNIAALDLIEEGLCDALVSDYYYPALSAAAFRLVDDGVLSLPDAWAMISSRPADILRLPDRGVVDYGRRADLVVVNAETRLIEATISNGRIAHLAGDAARRFVAAGSQIALAAE